jgi:hypothetical protein
VQAGEGEDEEVEEEEEITEEPETVICHDLHGKVWCGQQFACLLQASGKLS